MKSPHLALLPTVCLAGVHISQAIAGGLPSAPNGVTAVSGQILALDGAGLAGIRVVDNTQAAITDANGIFILPYIPSGKSSLIIDGRRGGLSHNVDYGVYERRIVAPSGATLALRVPSWLTPINHDYDVTIQSPTKEEVVVRNPTIPDFELHIAAGVVVRDIDGAVVTRIGLLSMPSSKTPVPLDPGSRSTVFFYISPGVACLYTSSGGAGAAQLWYPNAMKELPEARAGLWRYEPGARGWSQYGVGVVSRDGRQIVPDRNSILTDFASSECDPATRSPLDFPVPIAQQGAVQ